ncbi:MAG: histidine phosphatase family protein [Anaerolineae bacterium]|nr:histidine phosphatase family protein [Anaerolineae bacterium]
MHLLLVRHGQSQWQVKGDLAGDDAPLTALGESQAEYLGEYLAHSHSVDAIFTSPLRRARRTAEIVGKHLEMPVTVEPELCEFNYFGYDWAPPLPVSRWNLAPEPSSLSSSYTTFRTRILAILQTIVDAHLDDKTVLLVAHGGTLSVALRILLGSDTPRMHLWNASLNHIEWGRRSNLGEGWTLHLVNQMEHLPVLMRTV